MTWLRHDFVIMIQFRRRKPNILKRFNSNEENLTCCYIILRGIATSHSLRNIKSLKSPHLSTSQFIKNLFDPVQTTQPHHHKPAVRLDTCCLHRVKHKNVGNRRANHDRWTSWGAITWQYAPYFHLYSWVKDDCLHMCWQLGTYVI